MTATAHLQLAGAVQDALLANPALAGGRVKRGRAVPLQLDADNAIFVRLLTARGRAMEALVPITTEWTTGIAIDITARATAAQDAHEAVDELLQATFTRLAASEPGLGGFAWASEPEIHWQIDEADTTVGLATLVLPVRHLTGPQSLAPV